MMKLPKKAICQLGFCKQVLNFLGEEADVECVTDVERTRKQDKFSD